MVAEEQPILSQPLSHLFNFCFSPAQVWFLPESSCLASVFLTPSFFIFIRTHGFVVPLFTTRNRGEDRITQTVKGCQTAEFGCFASYLFIPYTTWSPLLAL